MSGNTIVLDHGSGGKLAHQLTTDVLMPLFSNPILDQLNDGAIFEFNGLRLAFSTDTFVVDPLFFSGRQYRRSGRQRYHQRSGHVRRGTAVSQHGIDSGRRAAHGGTSKRL